MSNLVRRRLARASQNWLFDTELATSADSYVRHLRERGYACGTIDVYLGSVAHFAHWCAQRHIGLAGINEGTVERFLKHLPLCRCALRCQRWQYSVRAALRILLSLLRTEGRIAPKKPSDPAAVIEEISHFEHYLKEVCGLRPTTCSVRIKRVRAFLLQLAAGRIRIGAVKPADVARFLAKYTEGWTAPSKRTAGDSLRSYFRFRAMQGDHTAVLSAAIPNVAQWRLAGLPKGMSPDQVSRLLRAFNRRSPNGKRDYAITRCFVDLGLRANEVARLQLDDFNWQQGVVHIRGKGRRVDVLPLPQASGRAIVDYLLHGRPETDSRALFMRHRPPLGMPATVFVVRHAVRYAAMRCGLESHFHGPHALRHSLAQRLVVARTPLKQIADVLRHRSLDSTTIYAKVDLPALSRVAQPWPGRLS
jgi:site-specific recombinase XerD